MDWPSLGSLGANNALVGTSVHCMSASAVKTAATSALVERANREGTVSVQYVSQRKCGWIGAIWWLGD